MQLKKSVHSSLTSHNDSDSLRLQKISRLKKIIFSNECIFIRYSLHLKAALFVSLIYFEDSCII